MRIGPIVIIGATITAWCALMMHDLFPHILNAENSVLIGFACGIVIILTAISSEENWRK